MPNSNLIGLAKLPIKKLMILLMFVFTQQGRFERKSIEIVFPILSISLDMIHPYQVAESRQYIIKRQLVVIDSYRNMTEANER